MKTWSTTNKVGLGLQLLYGLFNLPSGFDPQLAGAPPAGSKVGPPMAVMWACTVLAVIAIFAVIVALWKGSGTAARLASAATILMTITALPALFVAVPAFVKVIVAVSVVVTVVAVALTLSKPKALAHVH